MQAGTPLVALSDSKCTCTSRHAGRSSLLWLHSQTTIVRALFAFFLVSSVALDARSTNLCLCHPRVVLEGMCHVPIAVI